MDSFPKARAAETNSSDKGTKPSSGQQPCGCSITFKPGKPGDPDSVRKESLPSIEGAEGRERPLACPVIRRGPLLWLSSWLSRLPNLAGMGENRTQPGRPTAPRQPFLRPQGRRPEWSPTVQ